MTVTEQDIIDNASEIAAIINNKDDVTIGDLSEVTSWSDTDYTHVQISGVDKKIKKSNLGITSSQNIGPGCYVRGNLYVDTNITSTNKVVIPGKVIEIIADVDEAPGTTAIQLNMQKNGANDILNTELSIAVGATSGSSTDIDTDYDDFVKGDFATLDISQIGSSTSPGVTIRVTLVIQPT